MRERLRDLLDRNDLLGVVGLRRAHGHTGPHLFTRAAELEELALEPRYPLALVARSVLDARPEGRLGVVVRGCDERALVEMAKLGQVDTARLELCGVACSAEQARACGCAHPYPTRIDEGEQVEGAPPHDDEVDWQRAFERCIKCYGCRNACPVCLCDRCVLEEACWVEHGRIPPSLPFHLIRVYHVADKCVGCGMCEAACPVDIPLSRLHGPLMARVRAMFSYEPGMEPARPSPLTTTLEEAPLHGA